VKRLLILLIVPFLSFGQLNDKWRSGSAYSLSGKIYVLTIFISETNWEYDDKIQQYDKIYEAQNWITQQAKTYNKTIDFIGGQFGLEETIIMKDIPVGTASGNEPVDIINTALQKIGYSNPLIFFEWVKNNTDADNCAVLILANKAGNGYAVPCNEELINYSTRNKELYFLEGTILYRKYLNNNDLASASIAHELLHLFGAWDLYQTYAQPKSREDKAKELFPDDIMLRTSYDINTLKIDKLTAWLVGLSHFYEDWYEWFRPISKD